MTRSVADRYDIVVERDLREGVEKLAALHSGHNLGTTAQMDGSTDGGEIT